MDKRLSTRISAVQGGHTLGNSVEKPDKEDSLKCVQAQGSADTSGLGDSLQRIHAFSSTETSGYGEGGSPSPETLRSVQHDPQGEGRREGSHGAASKVSAGEKSSNQWGNGVEQNLGRFCVGDERERHRENGSRERGVIVDRGIHNRHVLAANTTMTHSPTTHKSLLPRIVLPRAHSMDAEVNAITSGHHGNYFAHRDLPSSIRRSGSQNSIRSNYFLGQEMSSTWLKWSQERRVSFKRRIRQMEVRQKELEEQRMSTPVRKARIESVKFVSPELEGEHVPEDEDSNVHERLQRYIPPPKSRTREDKDDMKLSTHHWMALVLFWEHPLFIRCRVGGIVMGSLALIITVFSLTNHKWSHYKGKTDRVKARDTLIDHRFYGASYSGLWLICSSGWHSNCTSTFHRDSGASFSCLPKVMSRSQKVIDLVTWEEEVRIWQPLRLVGVKLGILSEGLTVGVLCTGELYNKSDWQYAVIGLLIFSVAFGFLASMLAVCGLCTTSLPRKLYYYHSAGEIYLICAISTLTAVLLYPLAIRSELLQATHQHGLGFVLAWVAVLVFVASALCMCLDEIMRAATRFWQAVEEHSDTRV